MSEYLVSRLEEADNVTILTMAEVVTVHGRDRLEGCTMRGQPGEGADWTGAIADLYVMIGAQPHTGFLDGCGVELDSKGFIVTGAHMSSTLPGLYAVGDVRSGNVKRVATAVGEGALAVSAVFQFLNG